MPFVIHAVEPRWHDGSRGEEGLLQQTYESIFALVRDKGIKSIALPAISTGIFGFPLRRATEIALKAAQEFLETNSGTEITFYCFDDTALRCYQDVLQAYEEAGRGVSGQGAGPSAIR